jgi:hypothetical protein
MPNVHAGQPSSRPSTSGKTSSARPADTSTIPTGSGRGPSSARDSGSTAAARASAASPSGTLIRKIVRQPRPATSQAMRAPPSIGAPTTARPIVGPNAPNALPRSSGGNVALRMPKPCGISSAPSRPCATRKPISMPGEVASPHSADAATNPTSPTRNMRRRPYRSPRRPPVISPAAKASVYPAATHWIMASPPPSSARIDGAAMPTTVPSTRSMISAASTATRASQRHR